MKEVGTVREFVEEALKAGLIVRDDAEPLRGDYFIVIERGEAHGVCYMPKHPEADAFQSWVVSDNGVGCARGAPIGQLIAYKTAQGDEYANKDVQAAWLGWCAAKGVKP